MVNARWCNYTDKSVERVSPIRERGSHSDWNWYLLKHTKDSHITGTNHTRVRHAPFLDFTKKSHSKAACRCLWLFAPPHRTIGTWERRSQWQVSRRSTFRAAWHTCATAKCMAKAAAAASEAVEARGARAVHLSAAAAASQSRCEPLEQTAAARAAPHPTWWATTPTRCRVL